MLEHEIYQLLKANGFRVPKFKLFELNEKPSVDFYPIALKIESDNTQKLCEAGTPRILYDLASIVCLSSFIFNPLYLNIL